MIGVTFSSKKICYDKLIRGYIEAKGLGEIAMVLNEVKKSGGFSEI